MFRARYLWTNGCSNVFSTSNSRFAMNPVSFSDCQASGEYVFGPSCLVVQSNVPESASHVQLVQSFDVSVDGLPFFEASSTYGIHAGVVVVVVVVAVVVASVVFDSSGDAYTGSGLCICSTTPITSIKGKLAQHLLPDECILTTRCILKK